MTVSPYLLGYTESVSIPSQHLPSEGLETLTEWFREARRVLVITGAGLSADSGLPTYRGIGGLYNQQVTEDGMAIETALSGRMLATRPDVCWKYIEQIENACRGAQPNRGHQALVGLEAYVDALWILTQNVDGFHRKAGSTRVIPIHGDVHVLHCVACVYEVTVSDYAGLQMPPMCPDCGALVRPRVVLFGEMLPMAALTNLDAEVQKGFDLVVSVGTTSIFPYIRAPVLFAQACGKRTVEINPGTTDLSDIVDLKLPYGAADVLGAVWDRLTADPRTG